MKKFSLIDLVVEEVELPNGLKAYLVPTTNTSSYHISYVSRYGSLNTRINDKIYPTGCAHFLEHKMFSMRDNSNPFKFFHDSSSECNAYTSRDRTVYCVIGNKCFNKNLEYLIKMVDDLYINDADVEKEKGIILEEATRDYDNPLYGYFEMIKNASINNSLFREEVIGSIDDIKRIDVNTLEEIYKAGYNPSNMFIVITGNFDKMQAIDIIKNTAVKENINNSFTLPIEEENIISTNNYYKKDLGINYINFTIKSSISRFSYRGYELLYLISLYLELVLSINNINVHNMKENREIDDISYNFYIESNILYIEVYVICKNIYKLTDKIKELFNYELKQEDFNRVNKIDIANFVRYRDNYSYLNRMIVSDLIKYDKIIYDKVDIIRNLKMDDLKKVVNSINFNNISINYLVKE